MINLTVLILTLFGFLQVQNPETFSVRCDLQGMYDEIAQATLESHSTDQIDMYHQVFYTPDWAFVDADGHRHDWPELRRQAVDALNQPGPTTLRSAILEISVTAESASALIHLISVKTIVDTEGKYGHPGLTHTLADVTPMRDTWIKNGVTWRLRLREQIGATRVLVDKMPPEIDSPRCPGDR